MIGNKLGPVDRTVQLLIDRSYPVVKEVYLHLKDITNVYEHMESIIFVSEHVDEIQKVQDAANALIRINEHLDEVVDVQNNLDSILILTPHVDEIGVVAKNIDAVVGAKDNADKAEQAAKDAANSAQNAEDNAALAKKWAVGTGEIESGLYSSKTYAEKASLLKDEVVELHAEVKESETYLKKMEPTYKTLESHVGEIKTTAQNISSVVNVATDLTGGIITDASQDLGMVGDEDEGGTTVITGGNIKKVADEIQAVRTNADNIEDIKTVADAIETLPEIKKDLQGYVDETAANADAAEKSAELASSKAQDAADSEKYCKVLFDQITNIRNQFDVEVDAATKEAVQQVQNQEDKSKQVLADFAEEQKDLLDDQVAQATAQAQISTEKAQEATDQAELAKAWATKMDGSVDGTEYSAKYYANKAKEDFSQAVEQGKTEALDAIKAQETASVEAVQNEGANQLNLIKTQIDEATKQAEIAASKAEEAKDSADSALASKESAAESAESAKQDAQTAEAAKQESQNTLTQVKAWAGIAGSEETWEVTEASTVDTVITLPNNMKYITGRKHLRMVWNGLVLVKDQNYSEIGDFDSLSSQVMIHMSLEQGDVLNAWTVPLGKGEIELDPTLLAVRVKALEDLTDEQVYTEQITSGSGETVSETATLTERVAALESLSNRSVYKTEV